MEILFLLVWNMRQEIEFQKQRVLVQAMLAQRGAEQEEIIKAFDHLRQVFFPYDKNAKKEELKKMRDVLQRSVAAGPMEVRPLVDTYLPKIKSSLERGQVSLKKKADMLRSGASVQLDPFEKARRRPRVS